MKKAKFLISILLTSILLLAQVLVAFAAPEQETASIAGTVQAVTLETDPNSGVTTVVVEIKAEHGKTQVVRISLEAAESPDLGLVTLNEDGNPVIVDPLPSYVQIDPTIILSTEKQQNPVASAIFTFFSSSIPDLDYQTIMDAHMDGNGFGVIVQALFLAQELDGNAAMFQTILEAKKTNNFDDFRLDDGTTPTSWGQFRKAVADKHLGIVMSHHNSNNSDNGAGHSNGNANHGNSNNDKSNNGNHNGNGNGNPNKP